MAIVIALSARHKPDLIFYLTLCPVFLTNLEGKVGKVGKVGKEGRLRE
jgi:hypothetical protein